MHARAHTDTHTRSRRENATCSVSEGLNLSNFLLLLYSFPFFSCHDIFPYFRRYPQISSYFCMMLTRFQSLNLLQLYVSISLSRYWCLFLWSPFLTAGDSLSFKKTIRCGTWVDPATGRMWLREGAVCLWAGATPFPHPLLIANGSA